jgi:hypothetical protein
MSALLSRAYPISVIAASLVLDTEHTSPEPVGVRVEVDSPDGCRLCYEIPVEELGIPLDLHGIDRALSGKAELALPSGLQEGLQVALAPIVPGVALWLEFRRPFGYLPVIPWEHLLQPVLGAPVLRLPFSAVSAVSGTDPLRIALCAPRAGTVALREFLQEVVPALPARTHVDVFTADPGGPSAAPDGLDVTFHEPRLHRASNAVHRAQLKASIVDLSHSLLNWLADYVRNRNGVGGVERVEYKGAQQRDC